jgi:hypothetical protein
LSCCSHTRFIYGRDVGYVIENLKLAPEIEAISGTKIRSRRGGQ